MDYSRGRQNGFARQRASSTQSTFPYAPDGFLPPPPNNLRAQLDDLYPNNAPRRDYHKHNPYELPVHHNLPHVTGPGTLMMAVETDAPKMFVAIHQLVRERNDLRGKNGELLLSVSQMQEILNREYQNHQSDVLKLQEAHQALANDFDLLHTAYKDIRGMAITLELKDYNAQRQAVCFLKQINRLNKGSKIAVDDEVELFPGPGPFASTLPKEVFRYGPHQFQMDSLSETSEPDSRYSDGRTESVRSMAMGLDPSATPFTPKIGLKTVSNTDGRSDSATPRAGSVKSSTSGKSNKSKKGKNGKYKKPSKAKSEKPEMDDTWMGSPTMTPLAEQTASSEASPSSAAPATDEPTINEVTDDAVIATEEISALLEAAKLTHTYDPVHRTDSKGNKHLILKNVPIQFVDVCPHSLSAEDACPLPSCTFDRLCKVFNDESGKEICNSHNCLYKNLHLYRTCSDYLANGKCEVMDGPEGKERDLHIKYRCHPVGKNRVGSEEWKWRVAIAGLRGAHYHGHF